MSRSVRGRLVRGFGANAFGNVLTILIQLVSVPVFLRFWGTQVYGEWLVLSAVPYYVAMSDLGFGSVAATRMTMEVARDDRSGAVTTFQSAWVFISATSLALALVSAVSLPVLPVERWFHLVTLSHGQATLIVLLWIIHMMVVLQSGLYAAGFRCTGSYAIGVLYTNLARATEVVAALLVVAFGGSPLWAVCAYLGGRVVMTAFLYWRMRAQVSWLSVGFPHSSWARIRELMAPAFAFMAMPIGSALTLQGMVTAVGVVLGPIAVVIFSVTRTLSRVAYQMMVTVNNAIWPEMSAAFGSGNVDLTRRLHRAACQTVIWLMIPGSVAFGLGGPWIIRVWTHGHVAYNAPLLYTLLLVACVNSFWYTSAVVLIGSNRHQRMAILFLLTTCLSFGLALALMRRWGVVGVPLALLASDLAMAPYVLTQSLKLTHDRFRAFVAAVASAPDFSRILGRPRPIVVQTQST